MAFTFSCNACGQCCKGGGPTLSIEEVFKYQDVFICGLCWSAHYISDKPLIPHPAKPEVIVPSAPLKELFAFLPSFTTTGHTRYPVIFPIVTGYTLADGEPCSALNADGTCNLHADKPDMCRSVPFDAMLPETLQGPILARFKKYGCMTETEDAAATNVIFRDERITDAEYKAHYDFRLQSLRRDSRDCLNRLVELLGEGDSPGKFGLPSVNYFFKATERGAWIETSMLPLMAFLGGPLSSVGRVRDFIVAQQRLIEAAIEHSMRRRIKAHRERTDYMRRYLRDYTAFLNSLSDLAEENNPMPPR